MSKSRISNFANIIVTVIVLLLLLGITGGLIAWLAREDGLTVYVDYGEKRYTVNTVNASLETLDASKHEFTVGSLTGEAVDYTVEITVNKKAAFEFISNEKKYKWATVDCSKYFKIDKTDTGFTLSISADTNVTNCLRSVYDEIQYIQLMPESGEYFVMTVKTSYGSIAMPFGLYVGDTPYISGLNTEITLSTDTIIFG